MIESHQLESSPASHPMRSRTPRVAVICDFREERWPSMDLVGDMLTCQLAGENRDSVSAQQVLPRMPQPFGERRRALLNNAHRLLGRYVTYPRAVRRLRDHFDLFHIVDHSYAHLALELPPERTIVTCHDLDTFAALVPDAHGHNILHTSIAKRALAGLQSAAWITCDTHATRSQLLANRLASARNTSVVHNGVHPALDATPAPSVDAELARLLGRAAGESPEILHIGSTIERKRIQDVLGIFAKVRAQVPKLRLLRVGGVFTNQQQRLVRELGLAHSVDVLPHVDPAMLAAVYRRASAVIQPSAAEGFGLPVIEAMACGTPVIASDLPVLREVGGVAAEYCPVGDLENWSAKLVLLLCQTSDSDRLARRQACIRQASRFSWSEYTRQMVDIYQRVLAW